MLSDSVELDHSVASRVLSYLVHSGPNKAGILRTWVEPEEIRDVFKYCVFRTPQRQLLKYSG